MRRQGELNMLQSIEREIVRTQLQAEKLSKRLERLKNLYSAVRDNPEMKGLFHDWYELVVNQGNGEEALSWNPLT